MNPFQKLAESAKAVVGAIVPPLTIFVTQAVADLSIWATGALAALATAVAVYLTPNRPPSE
jgi:hypothetical protein